MTALTTGRMTVKRDAAQFQFPVSGGKRIYTGALVVMQSDGFAAPGRTATTLHGVGIADEGADATGKADGDVSVKVRRGCFRFANAAGDLITLADVGMDCYVVDDQTVAKTNGTNTRSIAGKVRDCDAMGVWVEF